MGKIGNASFAGVEGEIAVDQIRTVSRARLGGMLGTIDDSEAASIRFMAVSIEFWPEFWPE